MKGSELEIGKGKTKASRLGAIKFQREARLSYMRRTQVNSNVPDGNQGSILIVDDTQDNLRLLSMMLTEQGYRVRKAINGQMALNTVRQVPPDLILLDINMPEIDGYEVCKQLKADPATCEIPVIFLSAFSEVFDKVKAFAVGGADYISKPFYLEEVLVRVENQITIQSTKAQIRKLNVQLEERVKERTAQLETEILERQKIQKQLWHMALHDTLTGLPNRAFSLKKLKEAIERSSQEEDYSFALMFVDCDGFKVVKDSLGYLVRDRLLIEVARRLKSCLGLNDTLARLGGDEFTIITEEIKDISDATATAEKLLKAMSFPFCIEEREIFINLSIGIVLGTKDYQDPDILLRDADRAMYCAKGKGKACYQVFEADMDDRSY